MTGTTGLYHVLEVSSLMLLVKLLNQQLHEVHSHIVCFSDPVFLDKDALDALKRSFHHQVPSGMKRRNGDMRGLHNSSVSYSPRGAMVKETLQGESEFADSSDVYWELLQCQQSQPELRYRDVDPGKSKLRKEDGDCSNGYQEDQKTVQNIFIKHSTDLGIDSEEDGPFIRLGCLYGYEEESDKES